MKKIIKGDSLIAYFEFTDFLISNEINDKYNLELQIKEIKLENIK